MNWFKKKPPAPVAEKQVEMKMESKQLRTVDYPKKEYKVYWEKFVFKTPESWAGEVRFNPFPGEAVKPLQHRINAASPEEVEKIADAFIVDQMRTFRK